MPFSQASSSYAVGIESSSSIASIYNKSSATASTSSLSTYQNSIYDAGHDTVVQQYSNTGAAAPGFGQQPVMDGSGYGPSQNQTATACVAGTGLNETENKSHYNASLTMTNTQPTAGSTSSTMSQAYNETNNSFQLGVSGQYQNGGVVPHVTAQSALTQASEKLTNDISVKDGQEVSSSVLGTAQCDGAGTNSSLSTGIMSSAGLPASTISGTATISTAAVTKSSTPTSKSSKRCCRPLLG